VRLLQIAASREALDYFELLEARLNEGEERPTRILNHAARKYVREREIFEHLVKLAKIGERALAISKGFSPPQVKLKREPPPPKRAVRGPGGQMRAKPSWHPGAAPRRVGIRNT
jgi:hypothetical protein